MRGAGRIGGRDFKPRPIKRAEDPLDLFENSVSPFLGDLPVPPTLTPINDEWSVSDMFEPVDPRDCSKYPASPYCEGDTIRFGPPVGFEVEIRTNGCTTCLFIYPVVGWMKLTPTVVCRRDPNCRDSPPPRTPPPLSDILRRAKPKELNENVQPAPDKSPECAARESAINEWFNAYNKLGLTRTGLIQREAELVVSNQRARAAEIISEDIEETFEIIEEDRPRLEIPYGSISSPYANGASRKGDKIITRIYTLKTGGGTRYGRWVIKDGKFEFDPEWESYPGPDVLIDEIVYRTWSPAPCFPTDIKPPPPAPPPFGRDDDRKKKKGPEGMCCNSCRDAKENSDKLIKELEEIKKILGTGQFKIPKEIDSRNLGQNGTVASITSGLDFYAKLFATRVGTGRYPIKVPRSLLTGTGDQVEKIESFTDYMFWLTNQLDALAGEFPVDIEVKDIDPLKEGDQTKKIQLPNIAEAIAEIYGLTIKSSVNQEVELNMLLRLAAEVIATKNAAVVAQDYSRANATFLGYKANYKARELDYNFDFAGANLDPKAKEPVVLEKLLKTVKGYVQGWQIDDKETVVGFLQKLMFSAGIIKAVFFRGKGQQKELQREINSMTEDEKAQEAKFEAFLKEINDPNSRFNKTTQDKPEMRDETPPDQKPKGAK